MSPLAKLGLLVLIFFVIFYCLPIIWRFLKNGDEGQWK